MEYNIMMTGLFMITIVVMMGTGETLREPFCRIADTLNWPACAELQPGWGEPEEPAEEDEVCHVLQGDEGGSQCDQDENCTLLPGVNDGEWTAPSGDPIRSFVIKAGRDYHIYQSGLTYDGCYRVWLGLEAGLPAETVQWEKVGTGSHCQDVSHLQSWFVPLCTD